MKQYTQEDLDTLEENILEYSYFDHTTDQSCIPLDELKKILTTFFEKKIKL